MSRPFDEARYQGLLEGLEVAEIAYTYAVKKERIDPEGFGKTEAIYTSMLARVRCEQLWSLAEVSDGNHLSIADDFSVAEGVRYLRGQDISSEMVLDDRNAVFIPESEYLKLARSHIHEGDVLLTIVGANTGLAALVFEAHGKLTANCKLGILRVRKETHIQPAYLHAFLAGRFGQYQIQQSKRGAGQTGLILPDLKALNIPRFSTEFEQAVTNISCKAHATRRDAKSIFESAEQTLLHALGLQDWQPPDPLTYTRRAADVFSAARFDAEYFNPAKQLVIETLSSGPYRPLGDHVRSIRDMFVPGQPCSFAKVRNYDLTDALKPVLDSTLQPIPSSEIGSTKKQFQNGDVVISRLRSYLREIAIVRVSDDIPVMGSSEFIVLRPQGNSQLSPELLSTYLRSQPVQTILKSCVDGSQHPRFSEGDLLSIPVPDVILASAEKIDTLICAAELARVRAQQMLEAAKRAVEIAIEQGEAEALAYLREHGAKS